MKPTPESKLAMQSCELQKSAADDDGLEASDDGVTAAAELEAEGSDSGLDDPGSEEP